MSRYDVGMNRHHFSVFVHNCRLTLVARKEPDREGGPGVLSPTEWRWTIPEVCDGNWHHYAISMDSSQVSRNLTQFLKHNCSTISINV